MEPVQDIRFEPTLDERVEVTLKFLRHTAAGRALRRRALWKLVLVFSATMLVVGAAVGGVTHIEALAALFVVVLVFAAVIAVMFRQVSDWGLEQRVRAALERHVAAPGDGTCEIQLRGDAVWVRDLGVERTFPWSEATAIHDSGDSIELTFKSAIVVARGRAFSTPENRAVFLRRATVLAGFGGRLRQDAV